MLFLGANAVDLEGGITAHFAGHAELLRSMMEGCKHTIATIDSTKFGKLSVHRICRLDQVDLLITDVNLDLVFKEALETAGVPLQLV
jgi:DeoR family transcriptional regulator of aga operon